MKLKRKLKKKVLLIVNEVDENEIKWTDPEANNEDVIRLKFHLPDNLRVIRYFRQSNLIEDIFEFLEVFLHEKKNMDSKFTLAMYPNTVVSDDDRGRPISSLSLSKSSMCYVRLI